ncbi:MAG: hypothetical protein PVH87_26795 [Desulfobacteraceae bacterium]|jgi:hypothetical protein
MNDHLDKTLQAIEKTYADHISSGGRNYIEVDIGATAGKLGFKDMEQKYRKVFAVVPVKQARKALKVRIDGRTFVNYGKLPSGVAIPGYVIQRSNLSYKTFLPNDSMILNFV